MNMPRKALLLALCLLPSLAAAQTVFRLNVWDDGKVEAHGIATVVNVRGDLLLTASSLAARGNHLTVVHPADSAELVARILASDAVNDLALLEITGLGGEPLTLAQEGVDKSRKVSLLLPFGSKPGMVLQRTAAPGQPTVLQHNATVAANEIGAPLLNNCGELVGVSQGELRRFRRLRPTDRASALADVLVFLDNNKIGYQLAEAACLSIEAQLAQERQRAERAERRREEEERRRHEEARRRQAQLDAAQKTALAERERARLERSKARAEQRAKEQAEAEVRAREMENQQLADQAEAAQARRLRFGLLAAALLLALAGLGFFLFRRRHAATAAELQEARAEFPDILLVGQGPDGKEHRLKINGKALARAKAQGQIIGRSAQAADYMLNLDYVSRRHCQLLVRDGQLLVKDLGSSNGTAVDGQPLTPQEEAALQHGGELKLGPLPLQALFATDS